MVVVALVVILVVVMVVVLVVVVVVVEAVVVQYYMFHICYLQTLPLLYKITHKLTFVAIPHSKLQCYIGFTIIEY